MPSNAVRTFNARRGRMGRQARDALDRLLPRYGLEPGPVDVDRLFDRPRPVVIEIGCGKGEATVTLATTQPDVGLIAVDIYHAGVATLLRSCERRGLTNVRVVLGDGVALLSERVPLGCLAGIRAYFPDPWPKAKHHKRRLVRPDLVRMMAQRLRPGGTLHFATDWEPYAEQMVHVLGAEPLLTGGTHAPRPSWRPVTAYERAALASGRGVRDVTASRLPT